MCVCVSIHACLHVVEKEWERKEVKRKTETQKNRLSIEPETKGRAVSRGTAYVDGVFISRSVTRLTRSPERGLFFGRVGKASSFGLVSMAQ